jgi:hypothetical protein
MTLQEQITASIGAHGMWKARLQSAIETENSDVRPSAVRRDDHCEFGRWLNAVADPSVRNSLSYQRCVDLHRDFHQKAAKVLELALAGEKAAAEQAAEGDFSRVLASLTSAMVDWGRQSGAPRPRSYSA